MNSLLSQLSGLSKAAPINPRDIFLMLPNKQRNYEYLRDVQSEVLEQWFSMRDNRNCVIKMNTGSGKTVVGLLILQSCLNEGKGPAVYIVPDNYLISQVCEEAKKLGIAVTEDRDDYLYTERKAILVTSIYSLVNGYSAFGMKSTSSYPIGSIIMDDVHTCLDYTTKQFSLTISSKIELYNKMIDLFSCEWKQYNPNQFTDVVLKKESCSTAIIPFWMWQSKCNEVYKLISEYATDEDNTRSIYFNLPLIKDCLPTCDCFITNDHIEIIPDGIQISKIKSFDSAKRRIFMSATLSDDSVFSSVLGIKEDDMHIIVPDRANDIGDRLILLPRHLNCGIKEQDIRAKIIEYSTKYNVVVIVPSFEKALKWDPNKEHTINRENIDKEVANLKHRSFGLSIFVNRYSGIDLPDDACRILVIDGLPPLTNEKDRYIYSVDASNTSLIKTQIHTIEQAMGRGLRSISDSCCVVMIGDNLVDVLNRKDGTRFFSNATKAQYDLSRDLWELLKKENYSPDIDTILRLMDYSLNRYDEWIKTSKERISDVTYSQELIFDEVTIALRRAYDYASLHQWEDAINSIDNVINSNDIQESTKGHLMQVKAKYMNFLDKAKAQQVLKSGKKCNRNILTPIEGIRYDKTINNLGQSKRICQYLQNENNRNDFIVHVNGITSRLLFSPNTDEFERTLCNVGILLGFISTRPEKETGFKGPDNLWAIGNNEYFVIECKTGATSDTISKDSCNQLGGSVRWFEDEYGTDCSSCPILVQNTAIIDPIATIVQGMRIITDKQMDLFSKSINEFAIALVQDDNWRDENRINELLAQYKLRGRDIIANYTVAPTQ